MFPSGGRRNAPLYSELVNTRHEPDVHSPPTSPLRAPPPDLPTPHPKGLPSPPAVPSSLLFAFRWLGVGCGARLTLSDSEGDATEPLSLDNTLWAGTVLASGEALALVLYTGTDTRGAMNSAPPRSKAGSALALEWWWWWCELSPTQRRSQVASVDLQVNLLAKALPLKHAPTSQPLTRPLCKGALWSHGVDRAGDGRRALHPASRLLAAGERRDVAAAAAGAGATRVPDRTSEARPILLRDERRPQALLDFCRFLLLFSSIIPISLRVALDMAELAPPQRPLAHESHGERL